MRPVGMGTPAYRRSGRILSVAQRAEGPDRRPLTIFAAALSGPTSGFTTDSATFFGPAPARAPRRWPQGASTGRSPRPPRPEPPAGR